MMILAPRVRLAAGPGLTPIAARSKRKQGGDPFVRWSYIHSTDATYATSVVERHLGHRRVPNMSRFMLLFL